MPDLKSNIDDSLRDAAEHYPLKEPKDRWDAVAARLANPSIIPIADIQRKNNRKRFLWLFIFFFLATTATIFTVYHKGNDNYGIVTGLEGTKPVDDHLAGDVSNYHKMITIPAIGERQDQIGKILPLIRPREKEPTHPFPIDKAKKDQRILAAGRTQWNESLFKNTIAGLNDVVKLPVLVEVTSGLADGKIKSPPGQQPGDTSSIKGTKKTTDRGFHFGISGGPTFSKVKDGGFHKPGYEAGLLLGYRFSNKWSLETGILFTRNHYWVRKDRFNTEEFNAAMPQGMELMEVHGSNCVFRLPLNIRYDFLDKKKHRFFTTIGVSSSLMTAEHNDYTTMYNGSVNKINVSYPKNKPYFGSSIDLTIGLEHRLNKHIGFRIQPFYQVPLKKLGVGLVPVTTAGLRFTVVHLPNTSTDK